MKNKKSHPLPTKMVGGKFFPLIFFVFLGFFWVKCFCFWFFETLLEMFRGLSFRSEEDPYDFGNGFDSAGPDFWERW